MANHKTMTLLSNYNLPKVVNGIIIFSLFICVFNTKLYRHQSRIIMWDALEYYTYLPACFIYNDLSLKFTEKDPTYFSDKFWPIPTPNGGKITKMTMGMSILYSPFFFITHFITPHLNYEANGFSPPYRLAIQLACIFYLALGLFFLRKVLQKYFTPLVTAITLICITVGTNLYYYSMFEAGMSHAYNFSLFAMFTWLTIKWYENPSVKTSIILGLIAGLISLIRPSNTVIALFFIFYGIKRFGDISLRMRLFWNNREKITGILVFAFIIWIPQLIYWKYNTGKWFYYSYGKEGFFFSDPHFINGLFSYRKGWLLYTPMAGLMLLGLVLMYKQMRTIFWAIAIFAFTNFYIIVSWWTWWYGGGFGLRPMIDSYAIMAIPLACFIRYLINRRLYLKVGGLAIITILSLYSIFQTAQYYYGSIHWDSMTKESYWDSFLRLRPSDKFYSLIKTPDYKKALQGERNQ